MIWICAAAAISARAIVFSSKEIQYHRFANTNTLLISETETLQKVTDVVNNTYDICKNDKKKTQRLTPPLTRDKLSSC